MSYNYAPLAKLAKRLISQFGQPIIHRTYTAGTPDPVTADTTRQGAIFDMGAGQSSPLGKGGMSSGSLVQVGDKRLLVDSDAKISLQDHILVGTDEYVIISVGDIAPSGLTVIYDLHLRK